jgi:hypothetical protein
MANDQERLEVQLRADIRDFERNFQKANATASQNWTAIENRGRQASRRMAEDIASASQNIGRNVMGITRQLLAPFVALASAREIGQAADAFTRIQNALKVAGLEGDEAAAVFDRPF